MRRSDKEITNQELIDHIIRNSLVCRLAMVDGDEPYIVPVSFGITGSTIYFHSSLQGRKTDILRKNPKICFEFESDVEIISNELACKWSFNYRSIIGSGIAEIITNTEEKTNVMKVIMKQYSDKEFSIPIDSIQKTMVVKIAIISISAKQSG